MDGLIFPCTSTNVIEKKNGMCFDIKLSSSSVNPFKKLITPEEFNPSHQKQNFDSTDSTKLSQTKPYRKHVGSPYLSENETQKTDKWSNTSKSITFSTQKMVSSVKKKHTIENIRQKLFEAAQRRLCQNRYKNSNVLLKVSKVKQNRLKLFTNYRELVEMRLSSRMKQCDDRRTKKILSIQRKAQNESIKLKDAAHKLNITRQKIMKDYIGKLKQMENVTKLKDPSYQDIQLPAIKQLDFEHSENENKKTIKAEEIKDEQGLLVEVVNERLSPTNSSYEVKGEEEILIEVVNGRLCSTYEMNGENELLVEGVNESLCTAPLISDLINGDKELLVEVVNERLCPTDSNDYKFKSEKELLGEVVNQSLCAVDCSYKEVNGEKESLVEVVNERLCPPPLNSELVDGEKELLVETVNERLCPAICNSSEINCEKKLLVEVVDERLCPAPLISGLINDEKELLVEVVNQSLCAVDCSNNGVNGEKELLVEGVNEWLCAAPCNAGEINDENDTVMGGKECNMDCKNDIEVIEDVVQNHAGEKELELMDTSKYSVTSLCSVELRNEVESIFEKVNQRYEQCQEMLQSMNNVMEQLRQDMKIKPVPILPNAQCNKQSKDVKVPKQQKASKNVRPQVKKDGISGKGLVVMKDRPCCSILEQNEVVKDASKPKPKNKPYISQKPKIPWRY